MNLQDYIKIYKCFYRGIDASQLGNDCEVSMYTLQNFDKDYNCLQRLENIKNGCKDIESLNTFTRKLSSHIESLYNVFNDKKLVQLCSNKSSLITDDMKFVNIPHNRYYLSIDLKSAYGQFVDSHHIFDEKFDDMLFNKLPDFMRDAKKLRVYMYYQIPTFTTQMQMIITVLEDMLKSDHPLIKFINEHNIVPISYNMDEMVFDINDFYEEFIPFVGEHNINGFDVKVNIFEQHYISYMENNCEEKTISVRKYLDKTYYAANSCVYGNQLYKAFNNLPLVDNDLYVTSNLHSSRYSKLEKPIKITSVK